MPSKSKVKQYKDQEVNFFILKVSDQAFEVFGKRPFSWQLDAAQAILCGQDVVLDIGTGSGKTLCFTLPLLLNNSDIALTVSPLTALMIDQANQSKLPTVAVCQETLSKLGEEKVYQDITEGKFREVLVSPEIATSQEFHRAVLSKDSFSSLLRVVNIDEAHCINIWGGSFRTDYAGLGVLRGRFPQNVPLQIASATLPEHVLDDIRSKLRLAQDVKMIRVTNARPNIALSVRTMKYSNDSKADLRFLIPVTATTAEDIPMTIVYCNERTITEDCNDRVQDWAKEQGIPKECVGFYHALVGEKRKREIEDLLKDGKLRILFATEALGMGCDLRNIVRVVLWGLPSTFCALVQREGRAGRDLSKPSEAILIVPASVLKDDVSEGLVVGALEREALEGEALNQEMTEAEARVVTQVLDEEGVRVAADVSEGEQEVDIQVSAKAKGKRKKKYGKDTNIREARALSLFVKTNHCRRIIWDNFFENEKKLQLIYGVTTVYQPIIGMRCCDNCTPHLFPVENAVVQKVPGLKRGKKRKVAQEEQSYIRDTLTEWRDDTLVDEYYGPKSALSGRTLLGEDVIEKLATCGERIWDYSHLRRHTRWALGHDTTTESPNKWGKSLLEVLARIYTVLEDTEVERQAELEFEEASREAEKDRVNKTMGEERRKQGYLENTQKEWQIQTPADFGGS